tara:strand:+ start:67 stop:228 length:162 start_codon:yes stop_codon:yes gene_type:complete
MNGNIDREPKKNRNTIKLYVVIYSLTILALVHATAQKSIAKDIKKYKFLSNIL